MLPSGKTLMSFFATGFALWTVRSFISFGDVHSQRTFIQQAAGFIATGCTFLLIVLRIVYSSERHSIQFLRGLKSRDGHVTKTE